MSTLILNSFGLYACTAAVTQVYYVSAVSDVYVTDTS